MSLNKVPNRQEQQTSEEYATTSDSYWPIEDKHAPVPSPPARDAGWQMVGSAASRVGETIRLFWFWRRVRRAG